MDFIKDLIASRGTQLLARYAANGLIALGTKFALTISVDDANATGKVAAAFVGAGACWAIDHFSHAAQAADVAK